MKSLLLFVICCVFYGFYSADSASLKKNVLKKNSFPFTELYQDTLTDELYADYYLVVPATGKNYQQLHTNMYRLHRQFHIPVDTLGRYYNTVLHKIIVSEEDEDELYRGEYYPRRFESLSLSIENAYYYPKNQADYKEPVTFPTRMMVVAGMFDTPERADSLQKVIKKAFPKTKVLKTKVYIGCMH